MYLPWLINISVYILPLFTQCISRTLYSFKVVFMIILI